MSSNEKALKEMIERLIREQLAGELESPKVNPIKTVDKSGVACIKAAKVKAEPFDTGKAGDKVYLKDVLSLEESPRLGCGMMELDDTTFEWTLEYDEVDYIVEGILDIIIDGSTIRGEAGDIIFIPRGSHIQFSTPNKTRFMYVTYPADWADQ